MKQYLSFFKLKFAVGLQYRAAALAGISTQLFFGLVNIMVYMAFYSSGDTSGTTISISQLTTYLWLNQSFFILIYVWYKDNEILKMIRNGDIAYELCRPQNLYIMWFIRILASKVSAVLLRGIPLLIIASIMPKPYRIIYPDISTILIFIIAMILSAFIVTSLIVIMYLLSVYMLDEKGIFTIFSTISDILSGQAIPLSLFPPLLSKICSYLPFAYISDFAFRIFCKHITGSAILNGFIIQIIWLVILISIGLILTKSILKKAVIQGG